MLSRPPTFFFLTNNLRVIAAVAVQLKAVRGLGTTICGVLLLDPSPHSPLELVKSMVVVPGSWGRHPICDQRGTSAVNSRFPAICSALQPAQTGSADRVVRLRKESFCSNSRSCKSWDSSPSAIAPNSSSTAKASPPSSAPTAAESRISLTPSPGCWASSRPSRCAAPAWKTSSSPARATAILLAWPKFR